MKKKWSFLILVLLLAFGCNKDAITSYTVFYKVTTQNGYITSIRYQNTDGTYSQVSGLDSAMSWSSPTFQASQGNTLSIYAYCKNTPLPYPEVSVCIYFGDNSKPTAGEFVQEDSTRAGNVKNVSDSIVKYTLPH